MFGQNTFGGGSAFGANNQNKPAFGGFGATTTSQPSFGGGGLFGQQTTTSTGGKEMLNFLECTFNFIFM